MRALKRAVILTSLGGVANRSFIASSIHLKAVILSAAKNLFYRLLQ
jgi:hypothetical protein